MATMVAVGVSLETKCGWDVCNQFSRPLFEQMSSGRYDRVSLMPIPTSIDDWRAEHKTARKRADRAAKRGYTFNHIRRHQRSDEVYEINTSAPMRQGRPMTEGYRLPVQFGPLTDYPCDRHAIRTYGVQDRYGTLRAYLWLYRSGDLALVSQILGHDDYLKDEIMWLLWQGMLAAESFVEPNGVVVYNRHNSGTSGLRWWKERVGLEEVRVEWLP
jgi:hypothetical protein